MKFTNALLFLSTCLLGLSSTDGHGYVTISRNYKCKTGGPNSGCGQVQYEPQSLEAPKGYPRGGPPDGQIASAGKGQFSQLNQQTSSRWHKTSVSAGSRSFTWYHTAPHRTSGYEYYITRNGWNPNAPLTRAQFESRPFCTKPHDGSQPPKTFTHNCNLPSKSGYHVILAVWTIADTSNAFYNMIDVQYGGSNNPRPTPTPPSPTPPSPSTGGYCGGGKRGNGICADGTCCSRYGWCGCSSSHCINGQSCGGGSSGGTCGGGSRGDGKCADGTCCSKYGWCGCSSAHCTNGQSCGSGSSGGTCGGGSRGDGRCADGTCCSQYGWCGCSSAHCTGGQSCRRRELLGEEFEAAGEPFAINEA